MEKDTPSTAVNTQESCPLLDGPSPLQTPPSHISNNHSAPPPQPAKSPSSAEKTKEDRSYSSLPSAHTMSKSMDSPPSVDSAEPLSLAVSSKPTSTDISSNPPSPAAHKTLLITPQVSKLTSAASIGCSIPTDSPPASPTTASTTSPSSTIPMKRTFASMAKRVIVQERLRKAEEEDANDEEDGKNAFIFALKTK